MRKNYFLTACTALLLAAAPAMAAEGDLLTSNKADAPLAVGTFLKTTEGKTSLFAFGLHYLCIK